MIRPLLPLALAVGALALPAAATASAIDGFVPVVGANLAVKKVNGVPSYVVDGEQYGLELAGAVLDDLGAPVTGCLAAPARLRVIGPAGTEVGSSACASTTDGLFHVYASGIVRPGTYTAVLDAGTTIVGGQVVSAVQSAPVPLYVKPRMEKIRHVSVRGERFPVEGRVRIPEARTAGAFVLERKRGPVWRRVATQQPTRTGKFLFRVRVTLPQVRYWRVRFVPKPKTMWVAPAPVVYGLYRTVR